RRLELEGTKPGVFLTEIVGRWTFRTPQFGDCDAEPASLEKIVVVARSDDGRTPSLVRPGHHPIGAHLLAPAAVGSTSPAYLAPRLNGRGGASPLGAKRVPASSAVDHQNAFGGSAAEGALLRHQSAVDGATHAGDVAGLVGQQEHRNRSHLPRF